MAQTPEEERLALTVTGMQCRRQERKARRFIVLRLKSDCARPVPFATVRSTDKTES